MFTTSTVAFRVGKLILVVASTAALILPTVGAAGAKPLATERPYETTIDSPADLPGYHVYRPDNLDDFEHPLPVIVWANGGCVRYDAVWQPLLEQFAAAGMVVVAITTPPSGPVELGATTPADQAAAIDWASDVSTSKRSPYYRKLDLDRVAAAGNSCGGITSVNLATTDDRLTTVFVLSGSGAAPGTPIDEVNALIAQVKIPIAYITGGPEDISRTPIQQEYDGLPAKVPAFVARRNAGDHVTVSTTEDILVGEVAGMGIDWFDLVFDGDRAAKRDLTRDPCPSCPAGTWTAESKNLRKLVGRGDRE